MADIYTQTEIQSSVPGGFQEVVNYKMFDSTSAGIPILAIFLFLLSGSLFLAFALTIGRLDPSMMQVGIKIGIWEAGVGLAAIPATIVLHEVVHGHAMRIFGARPNYGMLRKHLVFYATAPGYAFRRNACITVEMAPLVVLSVFSFLGMFILQ